MQFLVDLRASAAGRPEVKLIVGCLLLEKLVA